jgi:glycosyltransferase involved in cell wall biosynthesis
MVPSDFPLAPLELAALGKPVISTGVDGIPEVVKPAGGELVAPNSLRQLRDAIRSIHTEGNISLRSKQALAFAKSFPSWKDQAQAFSRLGV